MNIKTILSVGLALLFLSFFSFFNNTKEDDHHDHDHHGHDHHHGHEHHGEEHSGEKKAHAHHHEAPHGGTLVVLGDEFAHIEFLLDQSTGLLQAYILDGMAIMGTRLQQPHFEMQVTFNDKTLDLKLDAQSNPLSGETVGDSSLYSVLSKDLIQVSKFNVKLKMITIKGITFKDIEFGFPEGNE